MRNLLNLRAITRLRPVALLVALAGALATAAPLGAHEIPKSVAILVYLKPEGQVLRVVARVPVEAMRDVQWPLRGPGYLDLGNLGHLVQDGAKLWLADNLHLYEGSSELPAPRITNAIISLQSDRSFESYESALAHAQGPGASNTLDLAWQQAMADVVLEYPIASAASRFSVDAQFARLGIRTTTVMHTFSADGRQSDFTWQGDPGLVHLDPQWFQSVGLFVRLGFSHILDGIDHLLFLLCLVLPFRRIRPLLVIVTAFTIAHSLTMIASALGMAPTALWFPPLVEVLIAASIVYASFENILGARLDRRWMVAYAFGLIHGFGFSFALRESMQFAGSHLAISLASFNIGVELAQIAVLIVAVPMLSAVLKRIPERAGVILASAVVAHTAWHWMTDRWAVLREFSVAGMWAALSVTDLRVILVGAIVAVGAALAARPAVRRILGDRPELPPAPAAVAGGNP